MRDLPGRLDNSLLRSQEAKVWPLRIFLIVDTVMQEFKICNEVETKLFPSGLREILTPPNVFYCSALIESNRERKVNFLRNHTQGEKKRSRVGINGFYITVLFWQEQILFHHYRNQHFPLGGGSELPDCLIGNSNGHFHC